MCTASTFQQLDASSACIWQDDATFTSASVRALPVGRVCLHARPQSKSAYASCLLFVCVYAYCVVVRNCRPVKLGFERDSRAPGGTKCDESSTLAMIASMQHYMMCWMALCTLPKALQHFKPSWAQVDVRRPVMTARLQLFACNTGTPAQCTNTLYFMCFVGSSVVRLHHMRSESALQAHAQWRGVVLCRDGQAAAAPMKGRRR